MRTANIPHIKKKKFVAERDRQFNIKQDLEKCQASFAYLLSDNPACGERFLLEECKLQPRDNRNILRCKSGAIKLRQRVKTLENKITERGNSLGCFIFLNRRLKSGKTCELAIALSLVPRCEDYLIIGN